MVISARHQCYNILRQSLFQYEPDCPGYPTEQYTVDVDGVQVADLTADEVQSRITDFSNAFGTAFPGAMLIYTLFKIEQNTEQTSLEWTVYEHWMDTSSSVQTMYWATSPRAMQSSIPSFLLVSLEINCRPPQLVTSHM